MELGFCTYGEDGWFNILLSALCLFLCSRFQRDVITKLPDGEALLGAHVVAPSAMQLVARFMFWL